MLHITSNVGSYSNHVVYLYYGMVWCDSLDVYQTHSLEWNPRKPRNVCWEDKNTSIPVRMLNFEGFDIM